MIEIRLIVEIDGASATLRDESSQLSEVVPVGELFGLLTPGGELAAYFERTLSDEHDALVKQAQAATVNAEQLTADAKAAAGKAAALEAMLT